MFFDPMIIIGAIESANRERERELEVRRKLWTLLPKNDAAIAEAKWEIERLETFKRRAHERELAALSRPRNFWGN